MASNSILQLITEFKKIYPIFKRSCKYFTLEYKYIYFLNYKYNMRVLLVKFSAPCTSRLFCNNKHYVRCTVFGIL